MRIPTALTIAAIAAAGFAAPGELTLRGATLACDVAAVQGKAPAGTTLENGQVYSHGFPPGHEGGASGWRQWVSGAEAPVRSADGSLAYTGKTLPSGYTLMGFNFSSWRSTRTIRRTTGEPLTSSGINSNGSEDPPLQQRSCNLLLR